MLHTSLLTFLPSPLLINLPPPVPLSMLPVLPQLHGVLTLARSPPQHLPAPPEIQNPLFLHPSSIMQTSPQQPLPSRGFQQPCHPSQKRSPPPPTPQIPRQGPEWHIWLPIPLLLQWHMPKRSFPPLPASLFFPSLWVFNIKSTIRNQPLGYGYAGIHLRCCATIPE